MIGKITLWGVVATAASVACSNLPLDPPAGVIHARFDPDASVIPMPTDILRDAETNRLEGGLYAEPYRIARALCLFAAVAAEVTPIDAVYTNYRDLDGLRAETLEARRDGFSAKLAIHPAQVAVINEVFTPSAAAIARAKAIIAAFAASPTGGVVGFENEMLDRPHLVRAERLLAQAKAAGLA